MALKSKPAVGLDRLEEAIARDLELLCYPPKPWVREALAIDGRPVSDVIIVGAGMAGLTLSFALRRQGINGQRLLDRSAAGREGPWATYARMLTLRSPNHLTGPAMGVPNLTFRAWYEALYGSTAWSSLGRIPRLMWMEYLIWYRRVLSLPVENDVTLEDIKPAAHGLDCVLIHKDGHREIAATRKLVLATGREGQARPRVPEALKPFVGEAVWHASDDISFERLNGKDVAVVGVAASALDNAATAIEAGARRVTLLVRADAIPRVNKPKGASFPGFVEGFPKLSPTLRFKFLDYMASKRIPPPRDSALRLFAHENVDVWLGAPVQSAERYGGRLNLTTPKGKITVDAVIIGTGFAIDLTGAPELESHVSQIMTYKDILSDHEIDKTNEWLAFPVLSPSFQFQQRDNGNAPYLRHIYCFSYSAAMSHGNVTGDIPAISDGADRLSRGLAGDLFVEDAEFHWQATCAYNDAELLGDEIPLATNWDPPVGD